MYKILLCSLLIVVMSGCGTTKQASVSTTSQSGTKDSKKKLAKVVEGEDGKWLLVAPEGAVVGRVYVQPGSTRPDEFFNGMIRIVGDDGLIGFANMMGDIQIQPSFFAATRFKGRVAAVVLPSGSLAASTDDAAVGLLTGNERWGVIGLDGAFFRNPVFQRSWDEKVGDYVYSCPTSSFWINDEGELQDF